MGSFLTLILLCASWDHDGVNEDQDCITWYELQVSHLNLLSEQSVSVEEKFLCIGLHWVGRGRMKVKELGGSRRIEAGGYLRQEVTDVF